MPSSSCDGWPRSRAAQRAEEYCHALKGVTGNIGAHALYEKVTVIDSQLKQGALPGRCRAGRGGCAVAAGDARDRRPCCRSRAQVRRPPPCRWPPVPCATLLARLAHALEYDLGAAESLLAELRAGVAGTPLEPDVAAVAALVDDFDIDRGAGAIEATGESLSETAP